MSRPQIIVNVTAALPRRGAPTATGTAFMAFAGAAGPTDPVVCRSAADATKATATGDIVNWVGDALTEGAPEVVIVRANAADPAAVTEAEWTAALGKFTDGFGPGQVLIPGVSDPTAYAALVTHAAATGRTVLLDGAVDAAAADLVTAATGLAAGTGVERAGLIAPWVTVPGPVGTTRDVPGSVIAAGLVGRNDAIVGHANNAPAGDQGRNAGVSRQGRDVTVHYTNDELDDLNDAGVSVIRQQYGQPTLYGWVSVSDDERFHQLNAGRMSMQLGTGIYAACEQFLFRQIDGQGRLFAELEGTLRGYLLPLWNADALYGDTADDAFDVEVAGVNTPETITAGELHAAVAVALTPHTEKVVIDVVTSTAAQGV
jgi:hypothetical protein